MTLRSKRHLAYKAPMPVAIREEQSQTVGAIARPPSGSSLAFAASRRISEPANLVPPLLRAQHSKATLSCEAYPMPYLEIFVAIVATDEAHTAKAPLQLQGSRQLPRGVRAGSAG